MLKWNYENSLINSFTRDTKNMEKWSTDPQIIQIDTSVNWLITLFFFDWMTFISLFCSSTSFHYKHQLLEYASTQSTYTQNVS